MNKKNRLYVYISRVEKDDVVKHTYKARSVNGKWVDLKFVGKLDKPKANFTLGTKGYVVLTNIVGNVSTATRNEKEITSIWLESYELADEAEQAKFKAHMEKVQKEYQEAQKKKFDEFTSGELDSIDDLPF